MYSKALKTCVVLAFGFTQSATKVATGVYIITSVATGGTVQDHGASGIPLFLLGFEGNEPISFWNITEALEGGHFLQNTYYKHYASKSDNMIVGSTATSRQNFFIESAGLGEYEIKLPDQDSVWTARNGSDGDFYLPHIHLLPADGNTRQRFTLQIIT